MSAVFPNARHLFIAQLSAALLCPDAAAEGLVLDGVPEIPPELTSRLTQYESTRWASLAALSSDGQQLLVNTRLGDTGQVHLVDHPGGARQQITFRQEPSKAIGFVPGNDRALLFSGDIGGNEQYQIFHYDLDTGRTTRLTDADARNGSSDWSPDGSKLAFSTNARNGKDFDIWLSDGKTPESAELLLEVEGHWHQCMVCFSLCRKGLEHVLSFTGSNYFNH